MHRQEILDAISTYQNEILPTFKNHKGFNELDEKTVLGQFTDFIKNSPTCFDRENLSGHITGSALVLNKDKSKIALTLHKKLGLWLQLGGHADSNHKVDEVALQEVEEESGLQALDFVMNQSNGIEVPFDFDVHTIPARKDDPEHLHFDVRYLIQTSDEHLKISDESDDLKWFTIQEARKLTSEKSMVRQFDKLESIIQIS